MDTIYGTVYDDCNVVCPYCEDKYQPEPEDTNEESRIRKCENCGKNYHLHQSIDISHVTDPDCEINNQEHDFLLKQLKNGEKAYFCKKCDKCKLYNEDKPNG